MCNADKDEYESDLRRNEQYLTNSENKVWKKKKNSGLSGIWTPVIPVQFSTNWANKPTGSWVLRFQIHLNKYYR